VHDGVVGGRRVTLPQFEMTQVHRVRGAGADDDAVSVPGMQRSLGRGDEKGEGAAGHVISRGAQVRACALTDATTTSASNQRLTERQDVNPAADLEHVGDPFGVQDTR